MTSDGLEPGTSRAPAVNAATCTRRAMQQGGRTRVPTLRLLGAIGFPTAAVVAAQPTTYRHIDTSKSSRNPDRPTRIHVSPLGAVFSEVLL